MRLGTKTVNWFEYFILSHFFPGIAFDPSADATLGYWKNRRNLSAAHCVRLLRHSGEAAVAAGGSLVGGSPQVAPLVIGLVAGIGMTKMVDRLACTCVRSVMRVCIWKPSPIEILKIISIANLLFPWFLSFSANYARHVIYVFKFLPRFPSIFPPPKKNGVPKLILKLYLLTLCDSNVVFERLFQNIRKLNLAVRSESKARVFFPKISETNFLSLEGSR